MEKRFVPLLIMLGFLIILIITPIIGALFEVPIIALDEPDISIASFDYWSVGHLLVGVALFVFFLQSGLLSRI